MNSMTAAVIARRGIAHVCVRMSFAMEATITFMRHGQSESNVNLLAHGQTGSHSKLSPRGEAEAKKAGARLKDAAFTDVFCSDTVRAHKTATLVLGENSHFKDASRIQRWERLRERFGGEMEGLTLADVKNDLARLGLKGADVWTRYNPEGGETMEDMRKRARKVVEDLFKEAFRPPSSRSSPQHPPHLLVVSHSHILFMIVRCLVEEKGCRMPGNGEDYKTTVHTNTGITRVTLRKTEGGEEVEVDCKEFNSADHLDAPTVHYMALTE